MGRPLNIAFVHPDLGIGGAERLVVDAALHLQSVKHRVTIFTTHHNRAHCFEATRDGTLDVRVYGDFLPFHIAQRLRLPSAIARLAYLACAMALRAGRFDVVFCDLVPHVIPLLLVTSRAPIIFYCHFPGRLLGRHDGLYRWYRTPIDWLEEVAIGKADRVLVNSRFTASMFHRAFQRLHGVTPEVVYPGVDLTPYVPNSRSAAATTRMNNTLLCVSRYEPLKRLELALDAFAALRGRIASDVFSNTRLVFAGGYDERLQDNRDTLEALRAHARRLGVAAQVDFLRSPTDAQRLELISQCRCVVYTPGHEHFGYVPVEAMAAGRPVVAVHNGGPAESIVDGVTGFLRPPTAHAFADAIAQVLTDPLAADRMGQAGRERVAMHFSRATFGMHLERVIQATVEGTAAHRS